MNMLYTCDPIKYAGMKLNFELIIFLFRMLPGSGAQRPASRERMSTTAPQQEPVPAQERRMSPQFAEEPQETAMPYQTSPPHDTGNSLILYCMCIHTNLEGTTFIHVFRK